MTIYGYARVSTDGQSLAAQLAELKAAKCAKIFQEKISGARSDRKQLARLMAIGVFPYAVPGCYAIVRWKRRRTCGGTPCCIPPRRDQRGRNGFRQPASQAWHQSGTSSWITPISNSRLPSMAWASLWALCPWLKRT
jgi:hypothetical protein